MGRLLPSGASTYAAAERRSAAETSVTDDRFRELVDIGRYGAAMNEEHPSESSPIVIDVDQMRRDAFVVGMRAGADQALTFYYDETNNIRLLRLKDGGLNVVDPQIFVLGGVVHRGAARKLDLAQLRKAMNVMANVNELKFTHIAKGDLLPVLKSPRVTTFLEWIAEQQLGVHFLAVDPLHWGLADIIDSILAETDSVLLPHAMKLKSDLARVLRSDLPRSTEMLASFGFPNITGVRVLAFVEALISIVEDAEGLLEHMNFMMLRGVLQMGRKLPELLFLDEKEGVLADNFGLFSLARVCLFKNSSHVFDEEVEVQAYFDGRRLMSAGAPHHNHHFVRSQDEEGIQLSDVVVGLIGRLFSWANQTELHEVAEVRSRLTVTQEKNRVLLSRTIDRSLRISPALSHRVLGLYCDAAAGKFLSR